MSERMIIVQKPNKTVYCEDGVIVKEFVPSHPKPFVYNEAFIHSCVEAAGVPVPKLISVMPTEAGGYALATEHIPGRTLQEYMDDEPGGFEKYLDKFVEIQMTVNSYKVPLLRNTRYKMMDAVNELTDIDPDIRYELMQRLHGMQRHTKLCHGDFVPSNIIYFPEDGQWKVLDWAHASQGNAGADAAITYMRFSLTDQAMADRYLEHYCLKTGTPVRYIQKWLPIVAAAQLGKQIPEEKELLERWIDVAEYQ